MRQERRKVGRKKKRKQGKLEVRKGKVEQIVPNARQERRKVGRTDGRRKGSNGI